MSISYSAQVKIEDKPVDEAVYSLADIIAVGRTTLDLHVTSKKRLLEEMATLLRRDSSQISQEEAFKALLERERLGPTGLGDGVAIPHGRVSNIDQPVGAIATLKPALEYDTPDDKPVSICLALLVPLEATDSHVRLLAQIAERLSDSALRESMLTATCPDNVVAMLAT